MTDSTFSRARVQILDSDGQDSSQARAAAEHASGGEDFSHLRQRAARRSWKEGDIRGRKHASGQERPAARRPAVKKARYVWMPYSASFLYKVLRPISRAFEASRTLCPHFSNTVTICRSSASSNVRRSPSKTPVEIPPD